MSKPQPTRNVQPNEAGDPWNNAALVEKALAAEKALRENRPIGVDQNLRDLIFMLRENELLISSPSQTATATMKEQKTDQTLPLSGGVETKTDEAIAKRAALEVKRVVINEQLPVNVEKIVLSAIREARASGQPKGGGE